MEKEKSVFEDKVNIIEKLDTDDRILYLKDSKHSTKKSS
jgi:hypothetical protein